MDAKLWKDMTPEEKGALLLAYHEGKVIEFKWADEAPITEAHNDQQSKLGWHGTCSYRVKPEPKKPREFWLVGSQIFTTERGANAYQDSFSVYNSHREVIHVREVL